MQTPCVVLLLGTSLFVSGVGASLCMYPDLVVVQIDDGFLNLQAHVTDFHPDVIVFDSGEPGLASSPPLTQLLKQVPNIPVIGIDLAAGTEVTIFSTQHRRVINTGDLALAIHALTSPTREG